MDTIHILIADDHPLVRVGLKALLASAPDTEWVSEAATGNETITLADRVEAIIRARKAGMG